ncbi:MAG: (2Fe-2S)-binding protein [Gemmataceae bacterium]|nr:(2Fe-2S)-binding protein [Gemmataceae bacterium]
MNPDSHICLCFRISRRKLAKFVRFHKPKVPSQLSECGGAGTGCGWCIPYLRMIFEQETKGGGIVSGLDMITEEEYASGRSEHINTGKGKPPKLSGE